MLAAHGDHFAHKLDKVCWTTPLPPMERMAACVMPAGEWKYQFRRGCTGRQPAAGSFPLLPEAFPQRLQTIPDGMGSRVARRLHEARGLPGTIASDTSPEALAWCSGSAGKAR